MILGEIVNKIDGKERINQEEGLMLLREADLLEVGSLADSVRRRFHPDGIVTFVADTNPNYTNVCDTECLFCAFWRPPGASDAYTLSIDEVLRIMKTSFHNGATTVLLQGGHNPEIKLDYYIELVRRVREEVPLLHLHAFSAPEISAIANYSRITTKGVLEKLWDAGLRTIPGGGAEILSNRVRKKIPHEISGDRYLRVLSLSRVYLDNFSQVQGSWFTQGKKMGSISLHYGASDLGGTLYDENVLGCAENKLRATINELVHMIKSAGFKPAQRDTFYKVIRYF